jgi:hypothetical protein
MKHLLLAPAVLVCVGAIPAQSATVSYAVDAIFENDGVYELGTPDGSTCYYGEDCYPRGFRLQGDPTHDGGYWSGLTYGDRVSIRVSFDPDDINAAPECDIAGWTDCGDFITLRNGPDDQGRVDVEFIRTAPTSAFRFDTFNDIAAYEGEAGSYFLSPCSEASPNQIGLPSGYCDFWGYFAEFSILDSDNTQSIVPVPVSPTLPLLAGALIGLGLLRRKAD